MYYRETIRLTSQKEDFAINVTDPIRDVILRSGICNGILVAEVPHSTAGIMATTGHCPEVMLDLKPELDRLLPPRVDFVHQETPEDASGHLKCALFGNSISAIVENGKLLCDDKLDFFLMEYDGPRHRKVNIAVIGDKEGVKS